MKYVILLNMNENTKQIEAEEQNRFVKTIFDALEIQVDWNPDEPLTVLDKINLRKQLEKYNINVIDDLDGGLKVYANNEIIGEWYKCTYKMKKDPSALDPRKQLYLEMQVNFYTIFENTA